MSQYYCTDVDNREKASSRDKKKQQQQQQRRRISSEQKHNNFLESVRKQEILAATKVKMSGSEKTKDKQEHLRQVSRCSCAKHAAQKFSIKCAAGEKVVFVCLFAFFFFANWTH